MKTRETFIELNEREMQLVNGGDFAYDFGFFLREAGIYILNGGNASGAYAASVDAAINYKPLH